MTRIFPGAALAAAVAALALPAAASAARGMEVAVSDEYAIVDRGIGDVNQALQAARALQATRMRILVQWNRVSDAGEPTPSADPDYNWRPIDDAIDAAAVAGMRTMLTLTGPAPAYASGDGRSGYPITRPDPQRFAAFARAAAEHFRGRVDRYGIWNEPNYPAWLAPARESPQLYRALFQAGYAAIKAADPAARVLIGETVPYGGRPPGYKRLGLAMPPLQWLRGVTCTDSRYRRTRCEPLRADGYAHHPYELQLGLSPRGTFPGSDNAPIQELGRLRRALVKLARLKALTTPGGRPLSDHIHLTESGYFTWGRRALPSRRRTRYLPEQFDVAAKTPGVRSMLQYNLYVPPNSPFSTGVLSQDGAPLPEYRSLLAWTRKAAGKRLIKRNTGPIALRPRPAAGGGAAAPAG